MRKVTFSSLRVLGVLVMALALVGTTMALGLVTKGPQLAAAQTPLCLDTAQFGEFDTNGDSVISRDELLAAGATEAEADLAAGFILNINCPNPIVIDLGQDGDDGAAGDGTDIDWVGAAAGAALCLDTAQFGEFDTDDDDMISRDELLAAGATEAEADLAAGFVLNINCPNPIVFDLGQDGDDGAAAGTRAIRGGTPTVSGATPAAVGEEFLISPDPAACQVEPRTADDLLALWYGPDGTPVATEATPAVDEAATNEVTVPVGPPADEATTAAVVETVRELFSCFAAGDILRAYALFTDDAARQFGPEPGTPREEAEAFLAEPETEGEVGEILAVANLMVLEDGRVGAFVVDRVEGESNVAFVIFEQQDDRWLVDEVLEFPPHGGEEEGA